MPPLIFYLNPSHKVRSLSEVQSILVIIHNEFSDAFQGGSCFWQPVSSLWSSVFVLGFEEDWCRAPGIWIRIVCFSVFWISVSVGVFFDKNHIWEIQAFMVNGEYPPIVEFMQIPVKNTALTWHQSPGIIDRRQLLQLKRGTGTSGIYCLQNVENLVLPSSCRYLLTSPWIL